MTRIERAVYLLKARCSPDEITDHTGLSVADIERLAELVGIKKSSQKFDR